MFTGHKTYGPSGIGVLYAKREHLAAMPPYEGGGDMIESVTLDNVTYNKPPHRFEAGTPAIVEAIGLGAALNYMMQIGREKISRYEAELGALRGGAPSGVAVAEALRDGSGQRRDFFVHHRRAASARRFDDHRPVGRRDPRRPSLRAAADGSPRGDGNLPGLFRVVQYQGRG